MNFWDSLDPKYRLILCDVWGVVHDGVTLYPGAADRLTRWRKEGRCVVLLTNAPRTAEAVEQQLARIGLPREAFDAVATSSGSYTTLYNRLRTSEQLRNELAWLEGLPPCPQPATTTTVTTLGPAPQIPPSAPLKT